VAAEWPTVRAHPALAAGAPALKARGGESAMAAAAYCRPLPARPMLIDFFYALRGARLPVSIHEYLALLEALEARVLEDDGGPTVERFYQLARTALVKDEATSTSSTARSPPTSRASRLLADFTRSCRSTGCARRSSSS
jgi:hypothetical protein